MRTAVTIASVALVLGGLAGCGGNDDSSSAKDDASSSASSGSGASQEEFCSSFTDMLKGIVSTNQSNVSQQVKTLKQNASDLQDVGAPDAMPDDAKKGLDVFVGAVDKIPDNASMKQLQSLGTDLSPEQDKQGQAFVNWAQTNCAPSGSASPSESPSQ